MSLQLETLTNEYPIQTNDWYERYALTNPTLIPKPLDVPDDHIAYNPSAIWTTRNKSGESHDILYLRVEPDRSCPGTSHLGKSRVRPYSIDLMDLSKPPQPYYDAMELIGEDAALTTINRKIGGKVIDNVWLLSCVKVKPKINEPDHVETLHTEFYVGKNLNNLEYVASGPEWMKDIRIIQDADSDTKLHIYGRPQPKEYKDCGNITHTTINSIDGLNSEVISNAPYIDDDLLRLGSGKWGGVNDIINMGGNRHILVAHRAWRTGTDGGGRHYEAVLYGHNTRERSIVDLGILATANMFPQGTVKADDAVDLSDVVFTGGGYNGTLQYTTFGVRDGSIGISGVQKH